MVSSVFTPLGITQSSYDIEQIVARGDEEALVANYDESLQVQPHHKYASQAGAALRLTVTDLGRVICALDHNALVSDSLLKSMYQPQRGTHELWGLGLQLYGEKHAIVGHDGGAFPRSGASFRFNPETGNGIGIMMAGGSEMIDPYIATWLYWETGEKQFDIRQVYHKHRWHATIVSIVGILVILFLRRHVKVFCKQSNL
jgi:CubicO group peptidase (beta-lactamase class C family)